jgi:hypothetical protein
LLPCFLPLLFIFPSFLPSVLPSILPSFLPLTSSNFLHFSLSFLSSFLPSSFLPLGRGGAGAVNGSRRPFSRLGTLFQNPDVVRHHSEPTGHFSFLISVLHSFSPFHPSFRPSFRSSVRPSFPPFFPLSVR